MNKRKDKVRELCEKWLKEIEMDENLTDNPPENEESLSDKERIIASRLKRKLDGADKEEQPKRVKLGNFNKLIFQMTCEWMDCYFETIDYREFQEHVKSHEKDALESVNEKDIVSYTCMWNICKFETEDHRVLKRHINFHSYHTKVKSAGAYVRDKYLPPRCDYDSMKRNILPSLIYDFKCNWVDCGYQFVYVQEFFDHVRCHELSIDADDGRAHCGWLGCEYSGSDKSRLSEHITTHTKQKRVACPHCGQMFFNYVKYLEHCERQVPVIDQDYQCTKCNKLFSTEKLMRNHILRHICNYQCSFCELTTNSRSSLILHIRDRHINSKPYSCTLCDYGTTRQYSLDNHIKSVHEGINIYPKRTKYNFACHCCEKEFNHSRYISRHLQMVHGYRLPPGFTRFSYDLQEDGKRRLQQERYESIELSKTEIPQEVIDKIVNDTETYSIQQSKDVTLTTPAHFNINHEPEEGGPVKIPEAEKRKAKKKKGSAKAKTVKKTETVISKNIEISIQDLDIDGNIIQTQIVQTEEMEQLTNATVITIKE